MPRKHYYLVDVFTDQAFGGNPLAVFTDGSGLSDELMQRIAKELNLSETTFVLPPDDAQNHYKVRIFTPARELPMAGHPTLGTTFILARQQMIALAGEQTTVRLEEGVGLIPVTVEMANGAPGMIRMQQPNPTFGAVFEDRVAVADALSLSGDDLDAALPIEVVSCGVPYLIVPLTSLDAIRRIRARGDLWEQAAQGKGVDALYAYTRDAETAEGTVHARMFAPEFGIVEDPATGSAAGPLGCYLVQHGQISGSPAAVVIEQGFEMARPSLLYVSIGSEGGAITQVSVGGKTVFMGEGELEV